jgi:hypothetical protein
VRYHFKFKKSSNINHDLSWKEGHDKSSHGISLGELTKVVATMYDVLHIIFIHVLVKSWFIFELFLNLK